jgi:hypothetical protein
VILSGLHLEMSDGVMVAKTQMSWHFEYVCDWNLALANILDGCEPEMSSEYYLYVSEGHQLTCMAGSK